MDNVISFPPPTTKSEAADSRRQQPMTLFLHVKRTTLIVHLPDCRPAASAGKAHMN